MRDFRIISTDRLTEDQQKQIEHILRECDQEFVPPISERTSTSQTDWSMEEKERGVAIYLKQLIKQHMLLAVQEEKVAGFLSYQDSFNCPILKEFPNCCYLTTLCVGHDSRGAGLSKLLYARAVNEIAERFPGAAVTLRTWSTNKAQLHILKELGFSCQTLLKDDRGEGVDTVYYVLSR
ncbi:MAG TPA: GNAT family N-acetyltransferase [Candidatus Hungatella pullicola]|nr:GNAT family N-acetyltransferase [Candidatus Hungatella pullicola]